MNREGPAERDLHRARVLAHPIQFYCTSVGLRAAGLSDLGRRVDLAERSVRHGEGDPELVRALKRDAGGDWD